ncbi:hypothetical protein HU200_001215 [Digitaria exilis]|uniref:Uncharacterized protein n=1 Tax=Digitaria exilis TaxID=1010633 RepID=A0A835G0L0_9POAL|nr:hypothetical protein HU200_001215 [Digitaria exilis]
MSDLPVKVNGGVASARLHESATRRCLSRTPPGCRTNAAPESYHRTPARRRPPLRLCLPPLRSPALHSSKLDETRVHNIVADAVDIECEFICDMLPVALVGMNDVLMNQYIEFVADRLLMSPECRKMYNVANPFDWMELISLQGKTNYFEKRIGDYQKASDF